MENIVKKWIRELKEDEYLCHTDMLWVEERLLELDAECSHEYNELFKRCVKFGKWLCDMDSEYKGANISIMLVAHKYNEYLENFWRKIL